MSEPLLVLNGIEVGSKEHLEELIMDLPEESKIALRLIYEEQQNKNN